MEQKYPKDGALILQETNLFFLVFSLLFTTMAAASPIPVVRVMVEREKKSIDIEGFDLIVEEIFQKKHSSLLNSTSFDTPKLVLDKKSKLKLECSLGGKITGTVESQGHKPKKYSWGGPLHFSSMGGFIRVSKSQYRDDLYAYAFNGDCIVVNHLDLEKYVAGLLASEMSSQWNIEALMAQAVAARTYALYQMKEASGLNFKSVQPPFDLDSSVKDQVYEGAQFERYKTIQAVTATRGIILSYDGKPIKAFYHSTCGGQTETPNRVWGMRLPYFESVRCGFCNLSPRFNWNYSISLSEIGEKFKAAKLISGTLLGLKILDRNILGRASHVELKTNRGTISVLATKIRDILGSVNVKSTDFVLESQGLNIFGRASKINFVGHGSGHAVGMCQWGAKTMGDKGYTFREILSRYYPKVQITKMY